VAAPVFPDKPGAASFAEEALFADACFAGFNDSGRAVFPALFLPMRKRLGGLMPDGKLERNCFIAINYH
jgi:hypothetical protein